MQRSAKNFFVETLHLSCTTLLEKNSQRPALRVTAFLTIRLRNVNLYMKLAPSEFHPWHLKKNSKKFAFAFVRAHG